MYMALKHSHFLFIALTIILFTARFAFNLMEHKLANNKAITGIYMASLTLLVVTGVGLMHTTGFMPFTAGGEWLTEKLAAFVALLVLQFMAIKGAQGKGLKIFAYIGALGWVAYILHVAFSHQALILR